MTTPYKLALCPCCGGKPFVAIHVKDDVNFFSDKFAVRCEYTGSDKGCGLEGQINKNRQEAIEAWNRRPREARLVQLLKEAREVASHIGWTSCNTRKVHLQADKLINAIDQELSQEKKV